MANTLRICSCLLLVLGIAVNAWLYPHPLMFAPYLILLFVIRVARRLTTRMFVLVYTLILFCVTFWFCWDAAFVHRSTLNLMPVTIAIVAAITTAAMWFVVRSIERGAVEQHVG